MQVKEILPTFFGCDGHLINHLVIEEKLYGPVFFEISILIRMNTKGFDRVCEESE